MIRSATISPCGRYRYGLVRRWGDGPLMGFMMLNPSTADAERDDPTIRRCIGFARREGCDGIVVVNLFPLRAADPEELWATRYPERFGPDSDRELQRHLRMVSGPLVAGWGADAHTRGGDALALTMQYLGHRMVCLGHTSTGAPRHPLYVRGDAPLAPLITIATAEYHLCRRISATGIERIAAERKRQIKEEDFTAALAAAEEPGK